MSSIAHLPYPSFIVDQKLNISESSLAAESVFIASGRNFLELVDPESRQKAEQFLLSGSKKECEVIMPTVSSPFAVYSLKASWHEDTGYLICTEKDQELDGLIHMVELQRKRLEETDFELFEKKDQLEKSLQNIRDLSGPFIKLSSNAALVPLFGVLDRHLIRQNGMKFTRETSETGVNWVIFDFHGIGDITEEGLYEFERLIQQLRLLGARSAITSINPDHAFKIHQACTELDVLFVNHLSKAIKYALLYKE